MDVTYWGRGFGVLLALDNRTGIPLYMAFVKSETVKDYQDAVSSIKERGYCIRGLIIDGKQSLFNTFSEYHIQMCQFHMKQILRRYLTLNPKMLVARDLRDLSGRLNKVKENDFKKDYQEWKEKWKDTLKICDEQPEFLSAIPVYFSAGGVYGNAKHKQQDRGHFH
mgnify:CR=1 FL=1